ncbi:MAG: CotH kinase family protein [Saprospiraceae bacterium]|nr:CotH kinase family protein [Saprospiraceae bacterium]
MKKTLLLCWIYPAVIFGQVNFQSSNLPIVIISTNGQSIPDEPKITAQMKVIDNGIGQSNHINDAPNGYDGFIGIERRGSTSQDLSDKKPYAVETRDANGNNLNIALLGMPAENDWAFLAPFNDKSLVRDAFTLEMARRIMPWASRTRFVELVLNGSYEGIYLVTERIKRDKNRVDIANLTATDLSGDDLTGGYIIKMDKSSGSQTGGWTSPYPPQPGAWQNTDYHFHFPKPSDIQPAQGQYIRTWMTDFENLMASPDYADSANGYPKYLDVQSFVDFVIINELTKNVDAYRLSTFFHKDKDSKDERLHAGPVWDFNIAMGNANYCNGETYTGWAIDFNNYCPNDGWVIHFWWRTLWNDPSFRQRLHSRWQELRGDLLTTTNVTSMVDSLAGVVSQAQVRNWQRWPVLHTWVWPNAFCCGTYQQHVDYLKNWLVHRLEWMDGKMATLNAEDYSPSRYFKTLVFPNPTDGALTFKYYVRRGDQVRLRVYDATGKLLAHIQTPTPPANGENQYTWEHDLPSGFYFYTVLVNGRVESDGKFVAR